MTKQTNEKVVSGILKVTPKVKAKLDKMSNELSMPRSQCINMLVTEWLRERGLSDV